MSLPNSVFTLIVATVLMLVLGAFSVKLACGLFGRGLVREPNFLVAMGMFALNATILALFPIVFLIPLSLFTLLFGGAGAMLSLCIGLMIGAGVCSNFLLDSVVTRKDRVGWFAALLLLLVYHAIFLLLAVPIAIAMTIGR